MEIRESARRHGVADADMLHALAFPLALYRDQGDLSITIVIGGTRTGAVIEVGLLDEGTPRERIIHAMPARPKYWP